MSNPYSDPAAPDGNDTFTYVEKQDALTWVTENKTIEEGRENGSYELFKLQLTIHS